jgi:hypothetical protein
MNENNPEQPIIIDQAELREQRVQSIITGYNIGVVAIGAVEKRLIESVYGAGMLQAALAQ